MLIPCIACATTYKLQYCAWAISCTEAQIPAFLY